MSLEDAINMKIKTILDKNQESRRVAAETIQATSSTQASNKAAATEAARKAAEEAAATEAARKAAEEAAAEAARKAAEEAAAEAARKAAEEAAAAEAAAAEAARKAAEEAAAAEEAKRVAEKAAQKAAEEATLADEAQKTAATEEAKRFAEEAIIAAAAAEAAKQAEEAAIAEAKRLADEAEATRKSNTKDIIDKISAIAAAVATKAFADEAEATRKSNTKDIIDETSAIAAAVASKAFADEAEATRKSNTKDIIDKISAIAAAVATKAFAEAQTTLRAPTPETDIAVYSNDNEPKTRPRTIDECEDTVRILKQRIDDFTKKQVCDIKTIKSLQQNQADLISQTDALHAKIHKTHEECLRLNAGLPGEVVERQTQNMNELLERMEVFLDSFHRVNSSMAAKTTNLRTELGQFIEKLEALHANVPEQLRTIHETLEMNPRPDTNAINDAIVAAIAAANESQEQMIMELNNSIEELRTDLGEDKIGDLSKQVAELSTLVKTRSNTIANIQKIQKDCFGDKNNTVKHVTTSLAEISTQLNEVTNTIRDNMDRSSTDSNSRLNALTKEIMELKKLVGQGALAPEQTTEVAVNMDQARILISQQNSIAADDLDHMATVNGSVFFFIHNPTGKLYKYPSSPPK